MKFPTVLSVLALALALPTTQAAPCTKEQLATIAADPVIAKVPDACKGTSTATLADVQSLCKNGGCVAAIRAAIQAYPSCEVDGLRASSKYDTIMETCMIGSGPTTAPVSTKPATTVPATTKPATTAPATTKPATTKPATTVPATATPAPSETTTKAPASTTNAPTSTTDATTTPPNTKPLLDPETTAPATTKPAPTTKKVVPSSTSSATTTTTATAAVAIATMVAAFAHQ